MKEEVALTVAGVLAKHKNELFNFLTGIKTELINAFEIGLGKYISDRENKISRINTFISRVEKLDFYEVYFPLTLILRNKEISSDTILDHIFP